MHFIRWCNLRHEVPPKKKKKSGTDKIYAYLINKYQLIKTKPVRKIYKVKLYLLQATPTPKRKQLLCKVSSPNYRGLMSLFFMYECQTAFVPGDRKKMTILTVVTKSIYGRHSADQWSRCDGSSAISKTAQAPSSPSNF